MTSIRSAAMVRRTPHRYRDCFFTWLTSSLAFQSVRRDQPPQFRLQGVAQLREVLIARDAARTERCARAIDRRDDRVLAESSRALLVSFCNSSSKILSSASSFGIHTACPVGQPPTLRRAIAGVNPYPALRTPPRAEARVHCGRWTFTWTAFIVSPETVLSENSAEL
jgi:hypothetical protein